MLCKYSGAIFIYGSNTFYYIRGHLLYIEPLRICDCCVTQTGSGVLWKVRFRLRITLSTLNYKVVYLRGIFYPQNGDNREPPCFIVSFWDFMSLAILYTLSLRETKFYLSYMQFSSRQVKHVEACSLLVALLHDFLKQPHERGKFLFPPSHPGGGDRVLSGICTANCGNSRPPSECHTSGIRT